MLPLKENRKGLYFHRGFAERSTTLQMNTSVISNNFGMNVVHKFFAFVLFWIAGQRNLFAAFLYRCSVFLVY